LTRLQVERFYGRWRLDRKTRQGMPLPRDSCVHRSRAVAELLTLNSFFDRPQDREPELAAGLSIAGNGDHIEKDGKKMKDTAGQYKKMPDSMVIAKVSQQVKTDAERI